MPGDDILSLASPPADERVPYGSDAHQFGDLRLPMGNGPHPVVMNIHGGFWRNEYDLTHAGHLCAALTAKGVATWNLEYRRIGNPGGGWPGTLPYSPLGKGFLTAKINEDTTLGSEDFRSKLPRFASETMKANQGFVDLLASIAKEKSATPAQIALAWLLVQKPWIVPIPGTTKLSRLEENIGAVGIELTEAELRTIDEASSKIKVEGDPIA